MVDIKCSKCGKALSQGAKFCSDCGTPVLAPIHKPGQQTPQAPVPQRPVRQQQRPVVQSPQPVNQAPPRKKKSPWGRILALTGGGIFFAACCVVIFAGLTAVVLFADIDLNASGTGGSGGGGDIISSEPIPPDALATQQAGSLPDVGDMVMTLTAVPGE